jgi:hypothetical protein
LAAISPVASVAHRYDGFAAHLEDLPGLFLVLSRRWLPDDGYFAGEVHIPPRKGKAVMQS